MNKNIKAAGILIYSFDEKGNIVFLLGKENNNLHSSKSNKYSDFGGSREKNESVIETAIREFDEESMSAILDIDTLKEKINDKNTFNVNINNYTEYVIKIEYNKTIPLVYNRIIQKLDDCMCYTSKDTKKYKYQIKSCPDGYLEKSEMKWFNLMDLKKNIKNLRKEFIPTITKIINILLNKKIIKFN